jgi:hypothetical protein
MGRTAIHADSVRITDLQFTGIVEANLSSGTYNYWKSSKPTWVQQSGFNGAAIANWLIGSGTNAGDPEVRYLCDQIYAAINDLHTGMANAPKPLVDRNGAQVGTAQAATAWVVYDEPNPIVIGILGIFWLAIWIYGIRRIYARRKTTAPPATV